MKKRLLSLLILIFLTIVSCGGKHITQKDFENSMNALQKGDTSILAGNDSETAEAVKIFSDAYKKITYKINKVTVNDNESILNVTVKTTLQKGGLLYGYKPSGLLLRLKTILDLRSSYCCI